MPKDKGFMSGINRSDPCCTSRHHGRQGFASDDGPPSGRRSGRGREGAEASWLEASRREIRSPGWAVRELQGQQRERVRDLADDTTPSPREGVPQVQASGGGLTEPHRSKTTLEGLPSLVVFASFDQVVHRRSPIRYLQKS